MYLSADAGSVSEGSLSAFFSFSSFKQTEITLSQQNTTSEWFLWRLWTVAKTKSCINQA